MEHSEPYPAPALAKGLLLLEQLAVDGQASLEHLAQKNEWPKSSTLRYLQTLEQLGAVRRHPDTLHWHAEKALSPLSSRLPAELEKLRTMLPTLAEATGHCAELYRVDNRTLRLIDRAEPEDSEVRVNARIGFVRDLRELDATAGLFYALTHTPPPSSVWYWQDGEKTPVSAETQQRILERIRETGRASDHAFNENGIRRHALPVFSGEDLTGILAVAQHLTPRFKADAQRIDTVLEHLSTQLRTPHSALRTTL